MICPLCLNHFDSQGDVYLDNVKLETVETIQKIMKVREERLEKVATTPSQAARRMRLCQMVGRRRRTYIMAGRMTTSRQGAPYSL